MFDPIDQTRSSGIDTPSGTPLPGLRAFVDLVTTVGGMLEQLHQGYYSAWSSCRDALDEGTVITLVLRLEAEMDSLRDRLGEQTFMINLDVDTPGELSAQDALRRTAKAGALLRQMHYNW